MKLSEDKKSLHISIDKNLSTSEVETLISDLSELRAHMNPAVPEEWEEYVKWFLPERILTQEEPSVMVKLLRDGRIRFWLRNVGLGWLIYNLTQTQAVAVRDYLVANTPDEDSPDFFSNNDQCGHTH